MLVLSRKVGQELVIGDNIRITVNRVGGSRVTLGISAPDDVRILRAELDPIVRSFEESGEAANELPSDAAGEMVGEPVAGETVAGETGDEMDDEMDESDQPSGRVVFQLDGVYALSQLERGSH